MAKTPKKRELPKGIERALTGRKPSADSEALLTDLIEIWGGTRRLAADLYAEYQAGKPGSMNRQKILDMIQRLIVNNTNHQIGTSLVPSDMTSDELETAALDYVMRLSNAPASS